MYKVIYTPKNKNEEYDEDFKNEYEANDYAQKLANDDFINVRVEKYDSKGTLVKFETFSKE